MRIAPRLVHVASLLLATGYGVIACGGSTTDDNSGGGPGDSGSASDASTDGKGDEPITACGGCNCGGGDAGGPVDLTASQACDLLASQYSISDIATGPDCQKYCKSPMDCQIPDDFLASVEGLNPDAGVPPDDGGARALTCPTDAGTVTITCFEMCTGRLTQGFDAPKRERAANAAGLRAAGERFAAMAFLEAEHPRVREARARARGPRCRAESFEERASRTPRRDSSHRDDVAARKKARRARSHARCAANAGRAIAL